MNDRAARGRFRVMEQVVLDRARGCRRVLDIGCGRGLFTIAIQATEVIGIDISRSALAEAHAQGVKVVLADGHALPFDSGTFDGIVSTHAAFAQLDHERALAECARVLIPGGFLAVHHPTDTIWTPRSPLRLTLSTSGATGKSGSELVARAGRHGFTVETIRLWRWLRVYPYLFPVPSLVHMRVWNHGIFIFRR
jgi:SAM-dependent methyltransferase